VTNAPAANEPKPEASTHNGTEITEQEKHTYGHEVNGQTGQNGAQTWNETEERVNSYNDGSAEEESRGVGIKEDG
jgi:hypothetical protein